MFSAPGLYSARLLILLLIVLTEPVMAGGVLDSLIMPGEVIQGHARFEQQCEQCHEKLKKAEQNSRCLACHDHQNIAEDIKNRKGFHGRSENVRNSACKHCHTDHKGRSARIVLFDEAAFDHQASDFVLRGAHQSLACRACHPKKQAYSQAKSDCFSCHEQDDNHRGRLGKSCDNCHQEEAWKRAEFDHDLDTNYPLEGKHRELGCKLCHAGENYKDTPLACVACHQLNDVHSGKYGNSCPACHITQEWKDLHFNHDLDTKYKLKGGHKKASCNGCHQDNPYEKKPKQSCYSCHRLDDVHKGVNGEKCTKCHTTQGWSEVAFDHAKDTHFPLRGKHDGLVCEACHKVAGKKRALRMECVACHMDDDSHNEQQGDQCQRCHNEQGWSVDVLFDHDLGGFPLIGQHSALACESCHISGRFKDAEKACHTCHQQDDVHEGRFLDSCENCHTPNDWSLWLFEHARQTDYPLEGKHEGLSCHSCHKIKIDPDNKMSQTCYSCHSQQDKHRKAFGRRCERCHTSRSFSDIQMLKR
ncbi:Cytochrome c3 [endosymbiont of Ridgeia piscesae]|jgi:hypothetical protein|uniref:Cytochrome c3 n=2 Tax=endosymbiont of Ridgeia piscesae TaxID=54398 RepID=A0A0T5YX57_9GAMM|nr:Cytochrome c3 [endosymbiont of Ridgeia piscesae]